MSDKNRKSSNQEVLTKKEVQTQLDGIGKGIFKGLKIIEEEEAKVLSEEDRDTLIEDIEKEKQ